MNSREQLVTSLWPFTIVHIGLPVVGQGDAASLTQERSREDKGCLTRAMVIDVGNVGRCIFAGW